MKKKKDYNEKMTIADLAKVSGINMYTLKFWLKQHLFDCTVGENGYYYFNLASLYSLAAVILYKGCDFSSKEILSLSSLSKEQLMAFHNKKISEIEKKIAVLEHNKHIMLERNKLIEDILFDKQQDPMPLTEEAPDFDTIVMKDLNSIPLINSLLNHITHSITYETFCGDEPDKFTHNIGIGMYGNPYNNKIIWQKRDGDKFFSTYIFLKNSKMQKEIRRNLFYRIKNMGLTPKELLGKFHIQFRDADGDVCTAFKVYIRYE